VSKKHAPFSPSGVSRWTKCSASVALSASAEALGIGDRGGGDESSYAREGTAAMAILERMLPGPGGGSGAEFADAVVQACLDGAIDITEVKPDMREALDYAARALTPWALSASTHQVEATLHIPQVPTYGHADFIAAKVEPGAEHLVVADYKHGEGIRVDAENNGQLMLYAAGAAAMFGMVRIDIPVTLIVVQPRHAAGGTKVWNTTLGTVLGFATEAGERSREFSYQTGPHCQFCTGAPICGLRIRELERLSAHDPDVVVRDTTGEVMAKVLQDARRVRELISRTEKAAIARLLAQRRVPGFSLSEGPGRLMWKSTAEQALKAAYGDRAYVTDVLSPAQVRDTLPGGKEFVQMHSFRRPGNPTLEQKDT